MVQANAILQGLSGRSLSLINPHLKRIKMKPEEILHEADKRFGSVYFPLSGFVSIFAVQKNGDVTETGGIGREGIVAGFFGVDGWRSLGRATVQQPGIALALNFSHFEKAFETSKDFRSSVTSYQASLYAQAQQVAACLAFHKLQSRFCFHLLRAQASVDDDFLVMTQEFVARTMGVRRTSVSEIAADLQLAGLISYKRGVILILDRKGLEKLACECSSKR